MNFIYHKAYLSTVCKKNYTGKSNRKTRRCSCGSKPPSGCRAGVTWRGWGGTGAQESVKEDPDRRSVETQSGGFTEACLHRTATIGEPRSLGKPSNQDNCQSTWPERNQPPKHLGSHRQPSEVAAERPPRRLVLSPRAWYRGLYGLCAVQVKA